MRRKASCIIGLLALAATLFLLTAPVLAANPIGGGSGGSWSGYSPDDEIVKDYRAARSIAVGLAAVGFLGSIGWWAVSADHPEGRYRAAWGIAIFSMVFLAAVLDKTVVQGVAGWFDLAPGDLPLFWR